MQVVSRKESSLCAKKSCIKIIVFFSLLLVLLLSGCSKHDLEYEKWNSKTETHEYALLTIKDAHTLGEMPPPRFPSGNKQCWSRMKAIGEIPENIKPTLKSYSVAIVESGYKFIQSTKSKKMINNMRIFYGDGKS
jgi:hypothetical protein